MWGEITYPFPNFNCEIVVISSQTLLGMVLLIHFGVKFKTMLVKTATDLYAMDIIDHNWCDYKHAYGLKLYME